jgi:Carbohydrate family 9 binding domain-like
MKTKTTSLFVLTSALLLSCSQPTTKKEQAITYPTQAPFDPPTYVCYKSPGSIKIDGKLSPEEWDAIPWTSDFVDIEGDKRPKPLLQTRAKMAYDDKGMYFASLIEEPHVWATLNQHDTVIYHDNDFEIFINPSNDTHNYLEYEVNAKGTDWDLFLTKPYRDNPQVLNNWEFAGMLSAVYVNGTLNNPKDTDQSWSVEVFIPWSSIYQVTRGKEMPEVGEQMRMNFSRVQWTTEVQDGQYVKVPIKGEDKIREYNWVWAPTGVINIHMPEYWGYVQFSDKVAGTGETPFVNNPAEEVKWVLRNLYYRQNEYAATFGHYATSVADLKPDEICSPEQAAQIQLYTTPSQYEMTLPAPDGAVWRIRQDGLVWNNDSKKRK